MSLKTSASVDLLLPVRRTFGIGFGAAGIIFGVVPVVDPLADIVTHISDVKLALLVGILVDRRRATFRVIKVSEVLIELLTPGIFAPFGATLRTFPLSFGQQALVDPLGVTSEIPR